MFESISMMLDMRNKRMPQLLLENIISHLTALEEEFNHYFSEVGDCNNNNLWNIHIIIPRRRSFSVLVIISGISPYTNRRVCILFSKQFYW